MRRILVLTVHGPKLRIGPTPDFGDAAQRDFNMELDKLTREEFAKHLGSKFHIHVDASNRLEVELIEAVVLNSRSSRNGRPLKRDPFSVVFRGPKDTRLPQRIYRFEHEPMGVIEMFIVPIGPDEIGMRYEAVFT
jgi:hypothetical protein